MRDKRHQLEKITEKKSLKQQRLTVENNVGKDVMDTDDKEYDVVDVIEASKIKEMPCKEDGNEDKNKGKYLALKKQQGGHKM
jgi:hypothetical protein